MAKTLDLFEYPNHTAAQTAYVSSASPAFADQVPTMTSNTEPSGVVSASNEDATYKAYKAFNDIITGDVGWYSGTGNECPQWIRYQFTSAQIITRYKLSSADDGNYGYMARDWLLQGSNNGEDWDELDSQVDQVWVQKETKTYNFINSTPYTYYRLYVTDAQHPANKIIIINEIELMKEVISLQCYSENTIIQQGTYSLRVEAKQTDSLNKTLTKTLTGGDKINLAGYTSLTIWAYASRTGTNIEVKIHDSGGNTITISIAIPTAGVWTEIELDISAVADADKDDIDEIKIEIIEAGASNTFYVDNFYGEEILNYPVSRLNKNRLMGYHCFMDQYLRAKREDLVPLKLPDGTVW